MASPENEPLRIKDRRDDFPIFIHSELDDYGLNNAEFRVYSRLARRAGQHGKHSESVPNMAREFDVSIRTVQYALKVLIACRLITRYARPGKTDEYSLNPRTVWQNRADLKQTRQSLKPSGATTEGTQGGATTDSGATREGGVVQPEHGVVVQPESDEGTPFEGTPFKEKQGGDNYPFDNFAVLEYVKALNPAPGLAIQQAEVIAQGVVDSELSRAVWTNVIREWKGNGYHARHAGKAVDKYSNEMVKIERGEREKPSVLTMPLSLDDKRRRQEELARRVGHVIN